MYAVVIKKKNCGTHVPKDNHILSVTVDGDDGGVLHDLMRQIKVKRDLEEHKGWVAANIQSAGSHVFVH